MPIDLIFGIDLEKPCRSSTYEQYVRDWHESMKQAVNIAQKHIDVGKNYNKQNYDKKSEIC